VAARVAACRARRVGGHPRDRARGPPGGHRPLRARCAPRPSCPPRGPDGREQRRALCIAQASVRLGSARSTLADATGPSRVISSRRDDAERGRSGDGGVGGPVRPRPRDPAITAGRGSACHGDATSSGWPGGSPSTCVERSRT
jgi:hypothetical protein